jgi:glycosyltransferase involved in cell wall biosynthesis
VAVPAFKEISAKISALKCCVIIPTFNNDKTLKKVVDDVLLYTSDIIIVNDGSTDKTSLILKDYNELIQIHYLKNKGKGLALRKGFKRAYEEGFKYAITIDSDGQHFASDIPIFITELQKYKKVLLIGARNMSQESVPKNSSFGNKFSNFWFWVETGNRLLDTQSGFRLYPLRTMNKIKFYTTKFEFEIEAIVKVAWRGIRVKNIPIEVLYNQDRVSHFRPYKDFARISVLNTWLVLVAFFYIKPRDFFLKIKRKGIKRFFVENFLHSADSPSKKAMSIALGVFIGTSPFWGFHGILALALAATFKLNKAIAFAFSNISIPPMVPIIIYASYKLGTWMLGTEEVSFDMDNITTNIKLLKSIKEYLVGSFLLGLLSALTFGSLSYIVLKLRANR